MVNIPDLIGLSEMKSASPLWISRVVRLAMTTCKNVKAYNMAMSINKKTDITFSQDKDIDNSLGTLTR